MVWWMKTVIDNIEALIKKKFKTKTAFATAIDQTPQWLNNKLKEHSNITLRDLEIIAAGLGETIRDLFPVPEGSIDPDSITMKDLIKHIMREKIEGYNKT